MQNWMRSLQSDLAHAYIVELAARETAGTDGQAAARAAEALAAYLKAERGVLAVDIHIMGRDGGAGYKVRDAERFQTELAMNPYGSRAVGIIPDAELMSEVVQNKLLKTIEEPAPGTVIFLICANREALLPTVRSRCVLLPFDVSDGEPESGTKVSVPADTLFYEFRKYIDKEIKSRDDALAYLGRLELAERGAMLAAAQDAGRVTPEEADALTYRTRRIAAAREDIMRGMGYKQALKRLYLEIKED